MTSTLSGPPLLVRDPDDKVVAGVCAAFGRCTDTDPVLWRVAVGVLTLFGGAGLALYALGWLLVPRRGEHQSLVERTLRRPDHGLSVGGVVLLGAGAVVLLAMLDDGPGLGVLLVLAGVGFLVARERRSLPAPAPTAAPYGPVPPPAQGSEPAPRAPSPRVRSRLGSVTVSAAVLVVGALLALRAVGVDGVTAPRVVAAALLVVGAGLVVGTWYGRARWLVAVGGVLVLLLGVTAAARGAGLADGLGERTWTVTGSASHRLGAGEAVLDLRGLEAGERADVAARVGFGQLTVLVPADTAVRVVADVALGRVSWPGAAGRVVLPDDDGGAVRRSDGDTDVHEEFVVGRPADVTVELDLEVGVGEIEVRRVAA